MPSISPTENMAPEDPFQDLREALTFEEGTSSPPPSLTPDCQARFRLLQRRWQMFISDVLRSENDISDQVSIQEIRMFLRWEVRKVKGKICQKISICTLTQQWKHIRRFMKFHFNRVYSHKEDLEMKEVSGSPTMRNIKAAVPWLTSQAQKYIKTELPRLENASLKMRAKPMATSALLKSALHFLWVCDERFFKHERYRVQLAFCMLIMSYTASRPGAIVESSAWLNSNDGLVYGDTELSLGPSKGQQRLQLRLRFRLLKGRRKDKSQEIKVVFLEEPSEPYLCPVTHFLALAFADNALENLTHPQELERLYTPNHCNSLRIPLKSSVQKQPILRQERSGVISETRIMSAGILQTALRDLGERAGYEEKLLPYNFRRGQANNLIRNKDVTLAQQNFIMGHEKDKTYLHYQSRIIGLDLQSIFLGKEQRTDLVTKALHMATRRNLLAPQKTGSVLHKRKGPPLNIPDEISGSERERLRVAQRKFEREEFQSQRKDFFEKADGREVASQLSGISTDASRRSSGDVQPSPSPLLNLILRHYPERAQIGRNFFPGQDDEQLALAELLRPLIQLSKTEKKSWFYSQAKPDLHGRCSACSRDIDVFSKSYHPQHLLECMRKKMQQQAEDEFERPCRWASQMCLWQGCQTRFSQVLPWEIAVHTSLHLKNDKPDRCLWEACHHPFPDMLGAASHLSAVHSIPSHLVLPQVTYCYECATWTGTVLDLEMHCRDHAENIGTFCGRVSQDSIVLIAAKCPFFLGNPELSARKRYTQFASNHELNRHITNHLQKIDWKRIVRCPHPSCEEGIESVERFWNHAYEIHGLQPLEPRKRSLRKGS